MNATGPRRLRGRKRVGLERSRRELEAMARQGEHPARDFVELATADERKVLPLIREFPAGAPRNNLPRR